MKLSVRITPNASKNAFAGLTGDGACKIRIQSPPVDGAANKGLIRFLSKCTGVSKSKIKIVRGEKSRDKLVEIDASEQEVMAGLKGTV